MRKISRSLYGRISSLYLALLLVFGGVCVWITAQSTIQYLRASEQQVNHELAAILMNRIGPLLEEHDPESPPVRKAFEEVLQINPLLEPYVVDADGNILAYYHMPGHELMRRVSTAPIQSFLNHPSAGPILGDHPCKPNDHRYFSAAIIALQHGEMGYLYVILHGESLETVMGMLRDNYVFRLMGANLLLALLFAGFTGLLLFALLTRRFRTLTATVRHFKAGDYEQRVDDGTHDEIGQLGEAFNEMAATIEAQVQALERTDAARRQLVANISHDFRTPLTSTRAYVERMLMQQDKLSQEEKLDYLRAILSNTVRLSELAEQLAVLSRLDAQQMPPSFEPFSIAELAQDVIVKFTPEAERRGIDLSADFGHRLPMVYADISLIDRVLSNLIDNALTNTPEGGTVRLDLEPQPKAVRVAVVDTGYGIPTDEIPLVAQRFYRTERSQTQTSGGTGLGLSIVREIIDLHGSTLHLESTVGKGTTVSFKLPMT